MRVLTAIGFVAEAGVRTYVATPSTKAITKPYLEVAVKIWCVKLLMRLCKFRRCDCMYTATTILLSNASVPTPLAPGHYLHDVPRGSSLFQPLCVT